MSPAAVEFVLVVEAGPLEDQACLLVDSLRTFGGRHADAAVTAVTPRSGHRPAAVTLDRLTSLGADVLVLDVVGACPDYPTSWRVHALAEVEGRPGPAVIVQLDSDTLFLDDIGPLCEDAPASARPVDMKGMGSTGPGDHYEPYWEALCALADAAVDDLPFVTTTVDGVVVRATHNGGFVAARRELGLFARADALFRAGAAMDLRPHAGLGLRVRAGVSEVGTAGSEWWGSAQAVVSVAAASLGVEIGPLPLDVNVPVHLWEQLRPRPSRPRHVHYHWLLADPMDQPSPMTDLAVLGSDAALTWLSTRVPLRAGAVAPLT